MWKFKNYFHQKLCKNHASLYHNVMPHLQAWTINSICHIHQKFSKSRFSHCFLFVNLRERSDNSGKCYSNYLRTFLVLFNFISNQRNTKNSIKKEFQHLKITHIPSGIGIITLANMWGLDGFPVSDAFHVVVRFLPHGKILLFDYLFPAKPIRHVLYAILLLLQILLCSLPSLVILFPVDRWAREHPVSSWPKDPVHLNQVQSICFHKIKYWLGFHSQVFVKKIKNKLNRVKCIFFMPKVDLREHLEPFNLIWYYYSGTMPIYLEFIHLDSRINTRAKG